MTGRTPYDDDRRHYSRTALARLVLADRAHGLSNAAANLAVTRYDVYSGAGGRVSEASTLTEIAERLLTSAVIFERERGSSWEDIGRYLGVSGAAAEGRFVAAVEDWRIAFEVPYRLDATGRKRIPQLPTAAYDPRRAGRNLDLWAYVRLGFDDEHAVTGGLDPSEDEESEPDRGEIEGHIDPLHLETFLNLLSRYLRHDPEGAGWDTVGPKLRDGECSYVLAGTYESIGLRLVHVNESELISVLVLNAHTADLRLRINTLLDAFGSS